MKHFFIGAMLSFILVACNDDKPIGSTINESSADSARTADAPKPVEFADAKYSEMANQNLAALQSKDVDGYMNAFADNAILKWNSGDSINGKVGITAFFKNLLERELDSLRFTNPIYLPVKVNQGVVAPGNYLLSWHNMVASFKGGIKSEQQIHLVTHFDDNDKIDYMSQFIDQAEFPKAKQ